MKANFSVVNVDDFCKTIQEVKRQSGRDSEEMLKYVMILMLQAGRSATKLGRKNRSLATQDSGTEDESLDHVSDDGPTARRPAPRFYRVYKQGSYIPRKIFVPNIPRKQKNNQAERDQAIRARDSIIKKFKKIHYRGIARASWGWAMKMISTKVNLNRDEDALTDKSRTNPIEVARQFTGNNPSIEVTNKLGWILRIAPGIEARIMASADSRMKAWLEGRFQTGIDRATRRAT